MASNRDIPHEQREFFKVFEELAYRHQYSTVYDDYLTMLINWFANGELQEIRDEALRKYSDKEKQMLNQMWQEHVKLFDHQITKMGNRWYDSLGSIYESITSSGKASAMGQFFTPEPVCDMMAHMTIGADCPPYQMISEPASGSGRMVLACHSIQPMNYYWAVDMDAMCAKMTAINMCMHNASGLVTWGDSLGMKYYRHWFIDRVQLNETTFVPYLKQLDDQAAGWQLDGLQELCRIMNGRPREKPHEVSQRAGIKPHEPFKPVKTKIATEQMKLF